MLPTRLTHLFVTVFLADFGVFLVFPAINDVIVDAVCHGRNACSLALYLTGFQQAITGLGAVVMMPVLGYLSDVYGRKKLLLIPLVLATIPFGILAWQRTTNFFYAYYIVSTLTGIVTNGSINCLALAYLADNVHEDERVSVFGILYGVMYASNLSGTLAARFLSTSHIFQVATAVSVVAVVYMVVLLKESKHPGHCNSLEHPILMPAESRICEQDDCESSNIANLEKKIPSPKDVFKLLKSSPRFSLLACISFFENLGDIGIKAFLLFFLKAQYNFKKDQFADILLITYIAATLSNVIFLPLLGRYIGEEWLLFLGLFMSFLNASLNSIGRATWVPYALAFLGFFFSLTSPIVRSMVSKEIGPNEQGIAQGCIVGVTSLAYIASPLIFTPLSAIFFTEDAPANFTGFSILCISLTYVIGLILSIFIKHIPHFARARA